MLLIPVTYSGAGYRSEWFSNVIVLNSSLETFESPGVDFGVICGIPEACESGTVPARTFGSLRSPNSPTGALLYVPRRIRESIHVSLHIGERRRNTNEAAISVPVVRETEFSTAARWLLFVPIRDVRTDLRLYQPDGRPLRIRLTAQPFYDINQPPVGVAEVTIPAASLTNCSEPSAVVVSLQSLFPVAAREHTYINVLVEALGSERFWAMASAIDPVTNHVHIVEPGAP